MLVNDFTKASCIGPLANGSKITSWYAKVTKLNVERGSLTAIATSEKRELEVSYTCEAMVRAIVIEY